MSGVVVPFVGRPEETARENLAGFIEHARALPFFSGENALPWDALTWDLRERSKSRGNRSLVLHFVDFDSAGRGAGKSGAVAIGKPFLETAKALVANAILSGQVSRPYRWLLALRAVDKAFREIGDEADLVALTPAVLDKAVSLIRAEHDDKNGLASSLEQIAGFAAAKHLTSVHLAWKSSAPTVRDQRRSIQVREDGSSNVIEKLPHLKCVLDLASVFLGAETGADAVTTAWFALAMFAPSRVSEILALPVGCETEMGGVYGISWRPAKGGEPLTKFATTLEWADVARTAIRRLKAIGEPARRAAAWYARNPGKLYLPPGYEHLRDQPLTQPEVYAILGVQGEFNNYALSRIIEPTEHCTTDPARTDGRGWTRLYDFGSLQTYVVEHLPLGFPYADRKFDLMAEDALFCVPRHTMRGNVAVQANVPDLIDPGRIYKDLNHPSSTVFVRHGLLNPETGQPWTLTSHQPRHLLNTLAQSKHLSQALIAFWSGRKRVDQNSWYDHIPHEVFIELYAAMGGDAPRAVKATGPLADKVAARAGKEMISGEDALRLEVGSVISTRYGLCRHNYSLTPCPKDKTASAAARTPSSRETRGTSPKSACSWPSVSGPLPTALRRSRRTSRASTRGSKSTGRRPRAGHWRSVL
ncbi:hypothetical protein RFM41_30420 [Mesorhizobium sp. VK25A]|uniref:Integrase n=1 Tax=Mesorhizobium vachelliae TaxID=3072309 RepID=A0ABU5AC24_9HYPH|nr:MULTISPECIES: hypothetical protein [unclassified Mesorhizobium]MDX8535245.1 hypothetical protein [Mesorhizobium sp. VK25D]MDX8548084.1 hypothetical protein [Mesorhizobium sp. VK25A]